MVFWVIEKFVKLCKKNIISELKKIDLKLTSTRHCKMMETVDWLRCHEMNTNRHPLLACHAYAWGTRKSTQYVQIPIHAHTSPHTHHRHTYTYHIHTTYTPHTPTPTPTTTGINTTPTSKTQKRNVYFFCDPLVLLLVMNKRAQKRKSRARRVKLLVQGLELIFDPSFYLHIFRVKLNKESGTINWYGLELG